MTSPNYGRTVVVRRVNTSKLPCDGYANSLVTALRTPDFDVAVEWTTVIKIAALPLLNSFGGPPDGTFTAVITYMIGGLSYSQTIYLASVGGVGPIVRRIPGVGTQVQVDVLWTGPTNSGSPNDSFVVSVGAAQGATYSELFLAPAYFPCPAPSNGVAGAPSNIYNVLVGGDPSNTIKTQKGLIVAMSGVLTTAQSDGSAVYPMAIDYLDESIVGTGSIPIPGTVGPALVSVGDAFSFSDEADPQCGFYTGLVVGLSTSPVSYQPVTLGAKFCASVKVGG